MVNCGSNENIDSNKNSQKKDCINKSIDKATEENNYKRCKFGYSQCIYCTHGGCLITDKKPKDL